MIVYTNKHKIPFLIDEDDWESVSRYSWYIGSHEYPTTSISRTPVGKIKLPLHCFLLGKAPTGLEWDHRNQNKLDNRRINLRAVTRQINKRNISVRTCSESGVKGVQRKGSKWRARIADDQGNQIHLGHFLTLEEAVQARLDAEKKYWGDNR